MNYYSTIVKNKIESDLIFLRDFRYGNLISEEVIVQGPNCIVVKYSVHSSSNIKYELIYFNLKEKNSDRTISLEEVDSIFILTAEEYVDYLKKKLRSDESGINKDGYWYVITGDEGWMDFHDGQYVISSYGFMRPDDIMNELCHEQVTNHSEDIKSYNRATNTWNVIHGATT
jgi:hypothetical protein